MAPAVSVIVPVYNVENHIDACIQSLLAQTYADFEAIVVDDGSTDRSAEMARSAMAGDPRFRLVQQANQGLSGARNCGLALALGDTIAFLDGDDQFAPEFLTKMLSALAVSNCDWVSCGLTNVHENQASNSHSSILTHPKLPEVGISRPWPLETWSQVFIHFPSAWNKVYKRSLIRDTRFDPDTWFEDHTWFARIAERTDQIFHLNEPLYLQTRDRAGQITAQDSDRVFEQFAVLDAVDRLLSESRKPGGDTAFPILAHRLINERSHQIKSRPRRTRYVEAALQWLSAKGIAPEQCEAEHPAWVCELQKEHVLTVVVPWNGNKTLLHTTLDSLKRQNYQNFDVILAVDEPRWAADAKVCLTETGPDAARVIIAPKPGAGPVRNAGVAEATGRYVVFVDAGDRLLPGALEHWLDIAIKTNADFGFSAFRMGLQDGPVHSGVHDPLLENNLPPKSGLARMDGELALNLHVHPSAKIFARTFFTENRLKFGEGVLESWVITVRAALLAERVAYLDWAAVESSEEPPARCIWNQAVHPRDIETALGALAHDKDVLKKLPANWARRLFARAVWEKLSFCPMSKMDRLKFAAAAAAVVRSNRWHKVDGPLDPFIGRRTRAVMNLRPW